MLLAIFQEVSHVTCECVIFTFPALARSARAGPKIVLVPPRSMFIYRPFSVAPFNDIHTLDTPTINLAAILGGKKTSSLRVAVLLIALTVLLKAAVLNSIVFQVILIEYSYG